MPSFAPSDSGTLIRMRRLGALLLLLCSCGASKIAVPPTAQEYADKCMANDASPSQCKTAGAIAVRSPEYQANGVKLLLRACALDRSQCESVAVDFGELGMVAEVAETGRMACAQETGELRDACEVVFRGFVDYANVQMAVLAGGDWQPQVAAMCEAGSDQACRTIAERAEEDAEAAKQQAEARARGAVAARERAEFEAKPFAERRKIVEAECGDGAASYACVDAELMAAGKDPLTVPAGVRSLAYQEMRQRQLAPCIKWYTEVLDQFVVRIIERTMAACSSARSRKEPLEDVVLRFSPPFGEVVVMSCGNQTTTTVERGGTVIENGALKRADIERTSTSYTCTSNAKAAETARTTFRARIEPHCAGTSGKAPQPSRELTLVRAELAKNSTWACVGGDGELKLTK